MTFPAPVIIVEPPVQPIAGPSDRHYVFGVFWSLFQINFQQLGFEFPEFEYSMVYTSIKYTPPPKVRNIPKFLCDGIALSDGFSQSRSKALLLRDKA